MDKKTPAELRDIAPPPSKVSCPIFDFHVHAFNMPETDHLLLSMECYGIEKGLIITNSEDLPVLRERLADRFVFCLPLDFSRSPKSKAFIEANLALIAGARKEGVSAIKFWFQPRAMARHRLKISDQRLQPLFDAISENNLLTMVHIADPDIWYAKYYADPGIYGTKDQHLRQLETFLSRNVDLPVVCAHLAGDPERLDRVSRLLKAYPNLFLDTAATKWMTRELSKKPQESRQFFLQHAHRILFGTDNYVIPDTNLRHFSLRYFVQRMFWETDSVFPSPIEDPDAEGPVRLTGLDLPDGVLRRLYYENTSSLLNLPASD